ncbi:membrane protein [Oceanobacillus oncorhynchi subsp. incaldanensis]|uniref:CD3337/EF1877 family mobilome membrane protein n=1 Tax=Oceanobacillus oncorhynchi TaxID=545501 RepID=UPI001B1E6F32|nr:YtxH domain-containing protein [Oceanobacillus oncorhynchi]GIO19339.1 membrane protein [Oceanobacillus oncorhynchi subsp. incaldanensis]
MDKSKWKKIIMVTVLLSAVIFLLFLSFMTVSHAAGLVDDTVSEDNLYSLYPLDHYQLDFYVDSGWDWLPWNWDDGIGKQVMYGLYTITNFIWIINLYLANATGYLVQQAYSLDFISETADAIGKNMQTLAGITSQGFGEDGFYVGFLLLFILIIGIYVAYTGLLKQETTKAMRAVINFLVVFILSASFIAYAPTYVTKINDFSADVSEAALDLGAKMLMPSSNSQGKDSVDMIRNNLFSIQIEQPWLLLQFDNSDKESIGEERVDTLVSTSPDARNGKTRENVVKAEIEDHDNKNLTITKTTTRLGMVFFLFLFNIGISIFVFLLSGMMIFSQLLFIVFAIFLPISFLLSMIPGFENMGKQAIMKLFNVIMLRAGITLVITVAFSISSMLYSLTSSYPFFLIAFLQIVTFAGIYLKLGDIMSMFNLQSNDSQQVGRSVMRRPRQMAHRSTRRLQRSIGRTLTGATAGAAVGKMMSQSGKTKQGFSPLRPLQRLSSTKQNLKESNNGEKKSFGQKLGQSTGKVLDTKNRVRSNIQHRKQQIQDLPTTAKYAVAQGKENLKRPGKEFKKGMSQAKEKRQRENVERTSKHRKTIAERRQALEQQKKKDYTKKQPVQKKSVSPLKKEKQQINPKDKAIPYHQPKQQVPVQKERPRSLNTQRKQANQFDKYAGKRKKQQPKTKSVRLPKQTLQSKEKRIIQRPSLPRKRVKQQQKPTRQRHEIRRNQP